MVAATSGTLGGVYIHTTFEPGTPKVTQGRQIEIDRAIGHDTGSVGRLFGGVPSKLPGITSPPCGCDFSSLGETRLRAANHVRYGERVRSCNVERLDFLRLFRLKRARV